MKRQLVFSLLILLLMPGLSVAATNSPNVPYNVQLTATETTITVDWIGDTNADGYYVYWDTTSGSLNNKETVTGQSNREFTISDLTPGTTYYVSVSAYNDSYGESSRSSVQSISTTKDIVKPATPNGLGITSIGSITENSVTLKWNENSESDLDYYTIYYGLDSDDTGNTLPDLEAPASSVTVAELVNSTRYYFAISATDIAGNESDKSKPLIVDTLVDTQPPFVPSKISGYLSDINAITITIDNSNSQMADFSGNILFYGATSGSLDNEVDLGNTFTHTLTDLEENSTWYFSALSYDVHGNKSARTVESSAVVEKTKRYLNQPDDFDGGCFIESAASGSNHISAAGFFLICFIPIIGWLFHRRGKLIILMTTLLLVLSFAGRSAAETADGLGDNIAGVFAAFYVPSDSNFEDYYGNNILLVSGFYERRLTDFVSMDLESGYMRENGNLLTESGDKTGIGSDLTLIPVAASVNLYYTLFPHFVGYVGTGLDYWYCKEETDNPAVFPNIEEWVGGCHGKAGVKLYNTDERFKNTGAIIETSYSWIARFGSNDTDLGGWAFKFGLFYQF